MRSTTMPARMAASERRNGIGRCIEIQAVPIDISASAIVSQPFSSAKVSASASAPSVPVANSAIEIGRPGRSSRLVEDFGRGAKGRRQHHRQDRERDRAIEMGDAGVERDQQRQRREHGGGRPHHRDDGADRAALRQESGDAEAGREDRGGDQMQRDRTVGGGRADAGQRSARQHQHVRIAAHRPFGEHDEDEQRRRRRPRRWPPARAMRRTRCRRPAARTRSWRRRHGNLRARSAVAPSR